MTVGLGFIGRDNTTNNADVNFTVNNAGSASTGQLTASIGLPNGASFASQSTTDGWMCSGTQNGATCTHSPLGPGQQSQGTITISVQDFACGSPVQLTVTGGSPTATGSQDISCR